MISKGEIIEGPFWDEPIEIKNVEQLANRIHIIGATIYSNKHIDHLLPKEELGKLKIRNSVLDFTAKGSESFLALEALRFHFASLFDPLLAINTSKIDPLPFQIEAVYGYILKLAYIRFLIADDPGAGKTIMAGLVIKELKLRGIVSRILIIVPGHLKDQWRRELKEKFQETFVVIDKSLIDANYGENVWQKENQIITSMDFAKKDYILSSLSSVHWDLVVVDEAHKMAAYKYGDKFSKTDRYKLGEVISKNSTHLLFLTATPHRGDPENFRLFLDLLVPGFFATSNLINESIQNRDNPLFIRRVKENLTDFEGKPIYTNRYPKTIKFRLSDDEKKLYNKLSEYVVSQYNKALEMDKRNNIAFALLILQRRMASSTYALLKSLERRKEKLENLLQELEIKKELISPISTNYYPDIEEIEDYDEKQKWELEKKWETISIAKNKEELQKEIETIKELISDAIKIIQEEKEVKIKELKKALEEGFKKIEEINGNKKILIFTESKDTMDYLEKKIREWGYLVNSIHGGMELEERIKAEKVFQHETEVMVATEAAGEGINLQFCHIMINYDIPWNPNKLEQRMGRIHRYGQQKDVYIFNLVAEDTREGLVLSKLLEKLDEIRNALGTDKVFDVIGEIFHGKNLYQLILDAVSNSKNIDDIIQELDIKIDNDYIQRIKSVLGESLATKHIDYTRIKEISEKAKEYRLIPEYTEEFFKRAFKNIGGKFKIKKDGFISIESIPYEIKKISEEPDFKNKFGIIASRYSKVTFDKELAFKNPDSEFISFGHPLFEALIKWVIKNYLAYLQRGAVFLDPNNKYNGVLYFFEGQVNDGKGNIAGKKIMAIYDNHETLTEINPAILWDLIPIDNNEPIKIPFSKEKAQEYAINILELYKEEIFKERQRQAEIKKKYGIKSLEYLIGTLDEELALLYEREAKGEKVDIVIRNKKERKEQYEKNLEKLRKEIEQEKSLTISMPKFLGAILIKPEESIDVKEIKIKEEIEKIGMQIAIEYELNQGRTPEDVSHENLGFDIRSKGENEIRYIEVKAKANEGDIELTPNEWFKAKRFKEQYYLYIITNALTAPKLHIIQDPVNNLNPIEKSEIVKFIIPQQEWKKNT